MKRPDSSLHIVPSSSFTWAGSQGVAEISDLQVGIKTLCKRVWNDAADIGFQVPRGTETLLFIFNDSDIQAGETTGWRFVSYDGREHILVIND